MQTPSDQEIQTRFDELPADVKQAIQSADMVSALKATGEAHQLHVDQLGSLEDEALLVMLGFANPAQFSARVKDALKVDDTKAKDIARDLGERLFIPIRNSMRAFMEERLKKQAASGGRPAASSDSIPAAVRSVPGVPLVPAASKVSPPSPAPAAKSAPAAPKPAVNPPIPPGGKIIMPSSVAPTIHPADQMLTRPNITVPATVIMDPMPDKKNYSVDPYREPIE